MAVHQSFLEHVLDDPDDDVIRLVYADWLEEHGEAARAEFIRVQLERARTAVEGPRRVELLRREGELLSEHGGAWLGPLRGFYTGLASWRGPIISSGRKERLQGVACAVSVPGRGGAHLAFRRGFLEGASTTPQWFLEHASDLARLGPIRELHCHVRGRFSCGPSAAQALAACPHLRRLVSLDLHGYGIGPEGALALAGSPHAANLAALDLGGNRLGSAGARALANSPHLGRLSALYLTRNSLGPQDAEAVVASACLPRLSDLKLCGNQLGPRALAGMASLPAFRRLNRLTLTVNEARDEGARCLARSPHAAGLTALNLGYNGVRDEGASELAESPHLRQLVYLNLCGNDVTDAGVRALASSPNLENLEVFNLRTGYSLGTSGAHALAASPYLRRTRQLIVRLPRGWRDPAAAKALLNRFGRTIHL
jgi:uncharacterized protein (TIGR02996 family)